MGHEGTYVCTCFRVTISHVSSYPAQLKLDSQRILPTMMLSLVGSHMTDHIVSISYHHIASYYIIQYHTIAYHTISYHTHIISHPIIPYHTISYRNTTDHSVSYHSISHHTIPCHIIYISYTYLCITYLYRIHTISTPYPYHTHILYIPYS